MMNVVVAAVAALIACTLPVFAEERDYVIRQPCSCGNETGSIFQFNEKGINSTKLTRFSRIGAKVTSSVIVDFK